MLSVESQLAELTRFAKQRGLTIGKVFTEAKSAKAPGARPIFNSMMQRLYAGEATGILCWKLDRLARNPVDGGSIIWAMKQHQVTVMTPFQLYGQSEDNVVWMYLEFGMAQKYVDDLSRNVKRGLRTKAEMGWFPCRPPLGYMNRVGPDGRKVIVKDPHRFEAVQSCWRLMLSGDRTPAQIHGVATTVLGLKGMDRKPIAKATLYTLFGNPFYYGSYEYPRRSGFWHEGRHTPMVTKEEFDLVQQQLGRLKASPRNHPVFAYTGLIRCGSCGGAVTAEEKHQVICPGCGLKFAHRRRSACPSCNLAVTAMPKSQFLNYIYYHCGRSRNPVCAEPSVRAEILDAQVSAFIKRLHIPDLHRSWLNRSASRLHMGAGDVDVLLHLTAGLCARAPQTKRKIATSLFTGMTLKARTLSVSPHLPFSFGNNKVRQGETGPAANKNSLGKKSLE